MRDHHPRPQVKTHQSSYAFDLEDWLQLPLRLERIVLTQSNIRFVLYSTQDKDLVDSELGRTTVQNESVHSLIEIWNIDGVRHGVYCPAQNNARRRTPQTSVDQRQ